MAPRKPAVSAPLPLKKVKPALPTTPVELLDLEKDLARMGCEGFFGLPWSFKDESMVRELEKKKPLPGFEGTIRGQPHKWTLEAWRQAYGLPKGGKDMATRKEDCTKDLFSSKADAKDGYLVSDCEEVRMRNVLAFLVPILHPEKPNRVTATLASTIILSYTGRRSPNWAKLVRDVVAKLALYLGRSKPSPLSPYLYHLYNTHSLLSEAELIEWDTQKNLQEFASSESEQEERPDEEEEEDDLIVGEVRKGSQDSVPRRTRATSRALTGGGRQVGTVRLESPEQTGTGSAFEYTLRDLEGFGVRLARAEEELSMISACFGNPPEGQLLKAIKARVQDDEGQRQNEDEKRELRQELGLLQIQLRRAEEEGQAFRHQAESSTRLLHQMQQTLKYPVDLTNKALLFEAYLEKQEEASRSKIIQFLSAQSCRMELIRAEMKRLLEQVTQQATVRPRPEGMMGKRSQPRADGMVGSSPSLEPASALHYASPVRDTPSVTTLPKAWTKPGTIAAGLDSSQVHGHSGSRPCFRSFLPGSHTPQALFGSSVTSGSTSSETAIARGIAALASLTWEEPAPEGTAPREEQPAATAETQPLDLNSPADPETEPPEGAPQAASLLKNGDPHQVVEPARDANRVSVGHPRKVPRVRVSFFPKDKRSVEYLRIKERKKRRVDGGYRAHGQEKKKRKTSE